jgi:ribosomal protein S18 acetylase RimI-like enzyme
MDGIIIKPLLEEEIGLLEQMNEGWPYGRPLELHRQRFDLQRAGEGVYLFAWHERRPVGHVFLRWQSTARPLPAAQRDRRAHVSDLFVTPDYWSRGIGTLLMDALESLAAEQGCLQVGLSVAVDNTRARSMYAARGYINSGFAAQPARWSYIDEHGEEQIREETLIYLLKQLPPV